MAAQNEGKNLSNEVREERRKAMEQVRKAEETFRRTLNDDDISVVNIRVSIPRGAAANRGDIKIDTEDGDMSADFSDLEPSDTLARDYSDGDAKGKG